VAVDGNICDGGGSGIKAQVHQLNGDTGLKVFTHELKQYEAKFVPALNATFGIEMAIDGAFGGTPDKVHDGLDSTLWTGSSIAGSKFTFNATPPTASPVSGGNAVLVNNASAGNVMQFDKGSDINLANYAGVSLYVYVTSGWGVGDSIALYGYDTGTGTQIQTEVRLQDYFNEFELGVWHKLSIPLSDFGLGDSTIDAFRFDVDAKVGAGPIFYIDDIQVEETGGGIEFQIKPPQGTKLIIDKVRFTIIDNIAATLASNSMTALSHDKILGLNELTAGIGLNRYSDGKIITSSTVKSVGQMILSGGTIDNQISDGTNTLITVDTTFSSPIVLDSRVDDRWTVVVNDDLSTLTSLTVIASGKTQDLDQ